MNNNSLPDIFSLWSAVLHGDCRWCFRLCLASMVWISLAVAAQAASIVGPTQISFSSSTGVEALAAGSFAQTTDGIYDLPGVSGINNGVSLDILPLSVTYNFDTSYDLTAFGILGEVGSNDLNGVRNFQLVFFTGADGSGVQIGSVFAATHTTPSTLQFFSLTPGMYQGARSFRFIPLSVQDGSERVEWSEVQFEGSASPVPEPGSLQLFAGVAAIGG